MFAITQKQYMLGTSFLAWSIHFLKGDNTYYFFPTNEYIDLPKNPFEKQTAHQFKRNLVYSLDDVNKFPHNSHCTFYNKSSHIEDVASAVEEFLLHCDKNMIPTIYIDTQGTEDCLGLITIREKLRHMNKEIAIREKIESIYPNFYKSDNSIEMLLNYFNPNDFTERFCINVPDSIFSLQLRDYVKDGVSSIKNIFKFLKFEMIEERFLEWQKQFYPTWQKIITPDYDFCAELKQIADKVHAGLNIDLSKYDMNFLKDILLRRVIRDEFEHA